MQNKKKILFLTPGASRAGGNKFLLDFLKWFRPQPGFSFLTMYGYGGALESEFEALSETILCHENWRHDHSWKGKIERKLGVYERRNEKLKARLKEEKFDLVYSNSVINQQLLSFVEDRRVPVVSHCHELESVIYRTGLEGFRETARRTTHFVAVSEAVKRNLVENHGVAAEKVSVVHGFIPIETVSVAELAARRKRVREELKIPENAFVVGGSGTLYWRKAPEIFVQVARSVLGARADLPIYFVWVGGAEAGDFRFYELNHDVKKFDLEGRVLFLENKPNPHDYFAALDLFAMTSREDPYPLVCLESASLGKPIVCFADAGGMPEFIEEDCGYVVPYLDVAAFAEKVRELYENPSQLEQMSRRAAEKVRERHDLLKKAPQILEIIEKFSNRLK